MNHDAPQLVTADDLNAYVDGELPEARRAEVAAWVAANPDAAGAVAAYRAQNQALQAAFNPVLQEPVPARLREAARPKVWRIWARHAAIAALYIAVGVGFGWFGAQRLIPKPMPPEVAGFGERAAVAHAVYAPEVRHPVEVAADEQAHLVAWLSKRLGTPLKAPVLTGAGYELVGGRLLPDSHSPAAQFMYQDGQGKRITVYVRVDDAKNTETAFRWLKEGNVMVCFWIDGPIGYALAGELDRKEMYRLAKLVYQQLNS